MAAGGDLVIVNSPWLHKTDCDSSLHLLSVFARSPTEPAAGNSQGSDQLEEGKALSARSVLPAPPGQGGFEGTWETGLVGCFFLSAGQC